MKDIRHPSFWIPNLVLIIQNDQNQKSTCKSDPKSHNQTYLVDVLSNRLAFDIRQLIKLTLL